MSFTLIVNPHATQDAEESAIWYEKQKAGLGKEFVKAIDEGINSIQNNPYHFSVLKKNFRRIIIGKFPFGIFYLIENNTIIILAVWHFKRKPFGWLRK